MTPSLISAKAITGNVNIDRSYVAPQPDKTSRFDAGFTAAYLGLPLKGHHTQEYIIGYINGTASYESDRGEMFGYSYLPPTPVEKKNSNFMGGYGDGLQYRNDIRNTNSTIPSHTNDDYRNYFIGYHNGV